MCAFITEFATVPIYLIRSVPDRYSLSEGDEYAHSPSGSGRRGAIVKLYSYVEARGPQANGASIRSSEYIIPSGAFTHTVMPAIS